jgi:hypothetical protein
VLRGKLLDLERHILDVQAQPQHYVMARVKGNGARVIRDPTKAMGVHGLHDWWYRRLQVAGVVAEGVTNGERMHKARHTAGQRVLDATGNSRRCRNSSDIRQFRRREISTPIGTSTRSRRRWRRCSPRTPKVNRSRRRF